MKHLHFFNQNLNFISLAVLGASILGGCSHMPLFQEDDTSPEAKDIAALRATLTTLTTKIESLEGKLASMNDKVNSTKTSIDNLLNVKPVKTSAILSEPTDKTGTPIEPQLVRNDPEAGFVNDSAIQSYRQALVLFQGKKYSEAVLAYSAFLEQYPDHALAGSAQYYVGESYFQNKEYKLAQDELNRVLTSYDRSRHVPETLKLLASSADALKQPEDAAKYRHLLSSLFPQSTAAATHIAVAGDPESNSTGSTTPAALDEPPPTAPIIAPMNEEKHE